MLNKNLKILKKLKIEEVRARKLIKKTQFCRVAFTQLTDLGTVLEFLETIF